MKAMHLFDYEETPGKWKPSGTVIDHPDAWRLVQFGTCRPVDAECQQAANLTEDEWKWRVADYVRNHGTTADQVDKLELDDELTEYIRQHLAGNSNIPDEIARAKGVENVST